MIVFFSCMVMENHLWHSCHNEHGSVGDKQQAEALRFLICDSTFDCISSRFVHNSFAF